MVAECHCIDLEEIYHVHGQRRSPSKMVDTRVAMKWWLPGAQATVRRYPMSKNKGEAPERW